MSDLICRKTMRACMQPGMCSPYGGCSPETPATLARQFYSRHSPETQAEVDNLVRKIHQAMKRGDDTQDHGLIGNLRCILDHVHRQDDPPPLV